VAQFGIFGIIGMTLQFKNVSHPSRAILLSKVDPNFIVKMCPKKLPNFDQ